MIIVLLSGADHDMLSRVLLNRQPTLSLSKCIILLCAVGHGKHVKASSCPLSLRASFLCCPRFFNVSLFLSVVITSKERFFDTTLYFGCVDQTIHPFGDGARVEAGKLSFAFRIVLFGVKAKRLLQETK
jgi:hypothetical protein